MKSKKKNKPRIQKNVLNVIPIRSYDYDNECYINADKTIIDIICIKCKDFNTQSSTMLERDMVCLTDFFRVYAPDIKIISINIPTNCGEQISYLNYKIAHCQNEYRRQQLEIKKAEQEWIEKNRLNKEFYIMYFANDIEEFRKRKSIITEKLGGNGLLEKISKREKDIVFMKMNNKNIKSSAKNFDMDTLEFIQPQGGISFSGIDYVRTGTGYETCIQIYNYPTFVDEHWLSSVCYYEGAITVIDIATENTEEAKKNINKSMREQRGRAGTDRNDSGIKDAVNSYADLDYLYEEISRMNCVLKSIIIRIYIKGRTLTELEKKEEQILSKLDSYKGAIMLNEQYYEFKSMYLPYSQQQKLPNARIGQPMIDEALAAGDPFHFSFLSDPNGTYLGSTACGGTINFNLFYRNAVRTYYNALILGNMGYGKSTLLKKLVHTSYIRGDFIRFFDVTGEMEHMAEVCGWKQINLDGTDGIFNIFQILKVDEDEGICYSRHISKLEVTYDVLSGGTDRQELITFTQCVKEMYLDMGILPEVMSKNINISGLAPTKYPTMSDFIDYIDIKLDNMKKLAAASSVEESLLISEAAKLNNIKKVFINVRDNFGKMLDGHTSIENIMDIPGVVFNIRNIASLPINIACVILFNTLSMCWDNCTRNGIIMKQRFEEGLIREEDIIHFLICLDEAHKVMNPRFTLIIQYLTDMQREMRKLFGGLCLATQSINECIPDEAESDSMYKVQDLFSFSNYKFVGLQDEALIPKLKKAFGKSLNDAEYERIPKLQRGQFILSMQGDKNIEFNVYASDSELELFRGGA